MLNDLNNVKPGEGRPAPSSRPASDPRGGAGAPSGNAAGGGRGAAGKAVVIDGVTYTHDSLPGPLYVTLEWRVDPTGKKPSHAMLDANDTKAVTSLYGDAKSKNLQSQLNNAKSANEALSIMGTARFFVKHQWNDTSDGWQRSSYMLERIVPVKF